jgi:hypothetical protein
MEQLQKLMGKQMGGLDDPDNKKFDVKVNDIVNGLDEEIRDRFKALKVIQDESA